MTLSKTARSRYLLIPIVLFGLWLAIELVAHLGAEMLWFEEVGYLPMYLLRISTQGLLGMGVFILTTAYLFGNLTLAQRLASPDRIEIDRLQAPQNSVGIDSKPQQILATLKQTNYHISSICSKESPLVSGTRRLATNIPNKTIHI